MVTTTERGEKPSSPSKQSPQKPVPDFQCLECKTFVPPDRKLLLKHLKEVHKISARDYYNFNLDMSNLAKDQEFSQWQYGCEYACRICREMFNTQGALARHLDVAHERLGIAKYETMHGPLMTKEKRRDCAICKQSILWSPFKIKQHLKSAHGLTIAKYFHLHIKSKKKHVLPKKKQAKHIYLL